MPQVSLIVNGRDYDISCGEGEEDHLRKLAAQIDGHLSDLVGSIGQVGQSRLLLMAALVVADALDETETELADLRQTLAAQQSGSDSRSQDETLAAERVQNATLRIEGIAQRLENP